MNPIIEYKCNVQSTRFSCHAPCDINESIRMKRAISGFVDLLHMTPLPKVERIEGLK